MIYKSFLPSLPLKEFIRNYTIIHFQFNIHEPVPFKQRSPKPEQKIVFYLKGSVNLPDPVTGKTQTPPPVAIFSHQMDKRTFQITNEFLAFIVFFWPGVLHRMIRLPMAGLSPEYCDAELFFGTEVRIISEQLIMADNYSKMLPIVEHFLLAKCKQIEMKNSVDTIAAQLLTDPTSFSLDMIARQSCLSTKQFYRKFVQRIGISPKFFSRLSRFNHAYRYKLAHPNASWSYIAQEFHYTDYHHLEKNLQDSLLKSG